MSRPPSSGGRAYTSYGAAAGFIAHAPASRAGSRAGVGAGSRGASGDGGAPDVGEARPTTRQGLEMRVATAGRGRQVQNASYWAGLLRAKRGELLAEARKHRAKLEALEKEKAAVETMSGQHKTLDAEVRSLEGELADYNLARDRVRGGAEAEEIEAYTDKLRAKNEAVRDEADEVLLERKRLEAKLLATESEISELHAAAQEKIKRMDRDKHALYMRLLEQSRALTAETEERQGDLLHLFGEVRRLEEMLSADPFREEAAALEEKLSATRKKNETLLEEVEASRLDPKEAMARMLAKARSDRAALTARERELKEATASNTDKRRQLLSLRTELEERKTESGESKLALLQEQHEQLSKLLAAYPEESAKHRREQSASKKNIVLLLQHMSKGIERSSAMPTRERVEEMRDEFDFKDKQLKNSEATKAHLEKDLAKRQVELDRIISLGKKIEAEMASLKKKMARYEAEMEEFEHVDSLRERAEETRALLARRITAYKRRHDMVRAQVQLLSNTYERKKRELEESETWKMMTDREKKIVHHEQSIFKMQDLVENKKGQTNWKRIKEECGRLADDLNRIAIERALEMEAPVASTSY